MKLLFFCALGDDFSGSGTWMQEASEVGKIAIMHYGALPLPTSVTSFATYTAPKQGFKIPLFLDLLRARPDLVEEADAVVFIDDDLVFPPGALRSFVETCRKERLDLAQPSVDSASQASWPHTRNRKGATFVPSDFVEAQCFYISARLLEWMRPLLPLFATGYALDLAMMHEVARRGLRSGIVHSAIMHHPARAARSGKSVKNNPDYAPLGVKLLRQISSYYQSDLNLTQLRLMSRLEGRILLHRVGWYALPASIVDGLQRWKRAGPR